MENIVIYDKILYNTSHPISEKELPTLLRVTMNNSFFHHIIIFFITVYYIQNTSFEKCI